MSFIDTSSCARLLLLKEHWPSESTIKTIAQNTNPGNALQHAYWLKSGTILSHGYVLEQGSGWLDGQDMEPATITDTAELLHFVFWYEEVALDSLDEVLNACPKPEKNPAFAPLCLLDQSFETDLTRAVLRLDQVDFPPGAVAYTHTHPGAGIRHLIHGSLNVISESGEHQMYAGDSWFEEADTPVKAIAHQSESTRFVRCMLLPLEYENKPTFTLVNPDEDASKPRLQTNTRHFDHRVIR